MSSPGPSATNATSEGGVPLVVDLDGTLTPSDTLWETLSLALRQSPTGLLTLPLSLLRGKARTKKRLSTLAPLDPARLPYNQSVLELISEARRQGRLIVLASGADGSIVEAVAAHLGIFDLIISSDGRNNRTGDGKLTALRQALGHGPFDYVGDEVADLPLFRAARRGYLVTPSSLERSKLDLQRLTGTQRRPVAGLLRLIRPEAWAKNSLLAVPLVLAQQLDNSSKLAAVAVGVASFSLLASAGYVLNDFLDVQVDRFHPTKKNRPFAANFLPLRWGPPAFLLMLAGGAGLGAMVGGSFLALALGYLLVSVLYSIYWKSQMALDVIILGALYTVRILAGGLAARVEITHWMLSFSLFFFVSLAFLKRYAELFGVSEGAHLGARDYGERDLRLIESLGPSSGLLAVLVFALYIHSGALHHYPNQDFLWGICPILLYWITRVWMLAGRGQMPQDPVVFAVRDRTSLTCAALIAALLVLATRGWRVL